MYLYGLQSLLTPLVSVHNPGDLAAAIARAKAVETGYNYVPNKALTVQVPPTVVGNPSMPVIATPTIKETTPVIFTTPENAESKIDALTKQMEQLTLNYANLTSVMLAKGKLEKEMMNDLDESQMMLLFITNATKRDILLGIVLFNLLETLFPKEDDHNSEPPVLILES